ncbi:methionine biosynthesis protein MetW [Alienimonas chondri]|uniref:Bifunctional methionine biosynthesis protein MetXA/MetW n=1 Tax=Alienimonas chondri TaxID=2681879 RepID=A0ABX1VL94_9PLAN|nr:methionine biosynthesis protein MetW [Alienimonas chondri]NNJ28100.1 Bifunctional methionine biosynthesis protein MetXA/MetW [Alienimonas chondri]
MRRRFAPPDPAAALTDRLISQQIAPGSRVLDLGCEDGRLLAKLRDDAGCRVTGVEVNEDAFVDALRRGVPVLRFDLDEGLPDLPDGGFDVAVLSQTLQQVKQPHVVLREMLRVAPRAVVVVPNFGHWRVRAQLLFGGRAPVTNALPHAWYDTPNLHVMTLRDMRDLAADLGVRIAAEQPIRAGRAADRLVWPNLRADSVLFVLERGQAE